MDEVHYVVVVTLVAGLLVRIAFWWGNRWKKRARYAYMIVGQRGETPEERSWGYCNALLAGEAKALKFYMCASLEKFEDVKPLTPSPFDTGIGYSVPFIFYDYYLPMRIRNFGTERQQELSWTINRFKEGQADASGYFLTCIAKLGLSGPLTILFMPCSSRRNYFMRFKALAVQLDRYRELEPELYSMRYISERKSKHKSADRNQVSAVSNIVLDANVVGKQNCILVDDVCTTGSSIRAHIAELHTFGVRVVGVVCLGKTPLIPTNETIMNQARKEHKENFEI